jgi:ketol-acid reductoisomerase
MVAPKCPGTEVREEYKRGFGVPTLIAVHAENDPRGDGLEIAKAYAAATGGHRAGVLQSSFIAEVKSDLMGEQTILCGMLQTGTILCYDKMVEKGIEPGYASKLMQYGWEDRHRRPETRRHHQHDGSPVQSGQDRGQFTWPKNSRKSCAPLYQKHMDDIISGEFSAHHDGRLGQ